MEVLQSVNEGFAQAQRLLASEKKIRIHGGIIVCALRSLGEESAVKIVELIDQFRSTQKEGNHVLAFDLAGDEGKYPVKLFAKAFLLANQRQIPLTCHAGEWNNASDENQIENMRQCLQYNVKRIGHGLILAHTENEEISKIAEEYRQRKIGIEICLSSNSFILPFSKHPLPQFLQSKMTPAGLNVDNSLLSSSAKIGLPNPDTEIMRALMDCNVSVEQVMQIIENGYLYSFDASADKVWVAEQMS